jgi:hypothetical protein
MNQETAATLVKKYQAAGDVIARAFGAFSLFGLFEREDNPGKLDLIVAAPWLKTDRRGLLMIAEYLPQLTPQEGSLIGRIVALDPDDEFVRAVNRMTEYNHTPLEELTDPLEVNSTSLGGLAVTHSFIIASHRKPPLMQEDKAAAPVLVSAPDSKPGRA